MKCGFSIGYSFGQKYLPIWVSVSVSDLNQNSGFCFEIVKSVRFVIICAAFETESFFNLIQIFHSIFFRYVQGPPRLSEQNKLALTERNMHAKIILKVVLKSWDYDIFGTTTSFYEMHTLRPLLNQMSVTLGFKKKSWFLSKFCLFFLLILNLYDWKFADYERLLNNNGMMLYFWSTLTSFCFIFIHFSDVLQKLAEFQQNQTIDWSYEASCHS